MKITHLHEFRENVDGTAVCIHRDLSCCPECAAAHVEIVEVDGVHYLMEDPLDRLEWAKLCN